MENQQLLKLLNNYSSPLKAFAYSFTKNACDADDLYQDTLLKAFRYFDGFTQGGNFKAWLFTIMRNTFINDYRCQTRKNALITTKESLESQDLINCSTINAATGAFVLNDVEKMLKLLPGVYSIPFIRHFEGYKYSEIADELDIPIGTVKTRIHLARELLKKYLRAYA